MAEKLTNTINIDGTDYEVTATEAASVANALKVKKATLGGGISANAIVEFDGSEAKTLEIMAPTGGKFSGPVRVPDATDISSGNSNYSTANGDFVDDAVLNYKDIKTKLLDKLLNTQVLYQWDGTKLDPIVNGSVNGISLITGTEQKLISGTNSFAQMNYIYKYISAYLYICTDTANIYYGSKDSVEAKKLATKAENAENANKLNVSHTILTNLGSTTAAAFNGTTNVEPGIKGILPLANGGLGGDISNTSSQAAKRAEYYINGSIDENTSNIDDDTWMLFRQNSPTLTAGQYCRKRTSKLWDYIAAKIRNVFGFSASNILSPANGGTGVSNLQNVHVGSAGSITVYTSTGNGATPLATYTTKKVILSNEVPGPSDGSNGDIWIKY